VSAEANRLEAVARVSSEPLRPFHWGIAVFAGLAFAGNGIDAGVVSFALPGVRAEWGLSPGELSFIVPVTGVGQLIGAIACGSLADRFGRRLAFCLTGLVAGLGTGLAGLAPDPFVLGLLLFVGGLGYGAVAPVAGALVSEFAPPAYRGRLIAVTQILWVTGWSAAATGGGWFEAELGWRGILALGGFPVLIGLLGYLLVPESPRFLIARGRVQEALDLTRGLERRHGIFLAMGELPRRDATASPLGNLLELWRSRFRRRTFTVWTVWVAMNAGYTGLIVWLPVILSGFGTGRSMQGAALVGYSMIPATILSALLIDRAGRRPLMLASLGVAAGGALALALGQGELVALIGAGAVACGVLSAWPVILSWAAELYPTRIRGTAGGWASGFARLGSIGGPMAVGLLLGPAADNRVAAVLPIALLLLAAVVCVAIFGQETVGRSLEETSA
jgi:putative MFS transporter